MPALRKKLGDFGEAAALAYLVRRGYAEVARKWRCAAGEIDLVMREGTTLAFVEVRTRRGSSAGIAAESVGPAKRARLIGLAYAYLAAADLAEDTPWRIDVVAVDVDSSGRIARLDHIRHAVEET